MIFEQRGSTLLITMIFSLVLSWIVQNTLQHMILTIQFRHFYRENQRINSEFNEVLDNIINSLRNHQEIKVPNHISIQIYSWPNKEFEWDVQRKEQLSTTYYKIILTDRRNNGFNSNLLCWLSIQKSVNTNQYIEIRRLG